MFNIVVLTILIVRWSTGKLNVVKKNSHTSQAGRKLNTRNLSTFSFDVCWYLQQFQHTRSHKKRNFNPFI